MDSSSAAEEKILPESSSSLSRASYPSEWRTEMSRELEKNNNPRRSLSESNLEAIRSRLNGSQRSRSEQRADASRNSLGEQSEEPLITLGSGISTTGSTTTIGSGQLSSTDSQTSGYTTESSYQTANGYERLSESSSLGNIQTHYGPAPSSNLQEIHVRIETFATGEEIQSIHSDLRDLLINEMGLGGLVNGEVIYLIAYHYM